MKLLGLQLAVLLLNLLSCTNAFNITKILNEYPEYSQFNADLTQTKLADEINSRETITVLVLSNGAMASLKDLDLASVKRVLSFHVLLDYFDADKLHQVPNRTTLSTTLYQTTGMVEGNAGFVNITDLKDGKVGFGPATAGSTLDATFVKSVKQETYNLSVVEVSQPVTTIVAEAPAPSPSHVNITAILIKGGCNVFADLISTTGVLKFYEDAQNKGGLTLFAPTDGAFTGITMKLLNKLSLQEKISVLDFHAAPVYSPLGTLKVSNGPVTTMASNYALNVSSSGNTVVLNTGVSKATISDTLLDDEPLVIFTVNKVLEPKELFGTAASPTREAEPPKAGTTKATPVSSPAVPAGPVETPKGSDTNKSSSTSFVPASGGLLAFWVACIGVFLL